jgi:hypothetical protein
MRYSFRASTPLEEEGGATQAEIASMEQRRSGDTLYGVNAGLYIRGQTFCAISTCLFVSETCLEAYVDMGEVYDEKLIDHGSG